MDKDNQIKILTKALQVYAKKSRYTIGEGGNFVSSYRYWEFNSNSMGCDKYKPWLLAEKALNEIKKIDIFGE